MPWKTRRAASSGAGKQLGHRQLRAIDVALHLDELDRWARAVAALVHDAVAGILPALVDQPASTRAVVLDIAITIAVAIVGDPSEGCFDVNAQFVEELEVATPRGMLGKQDEEERRRVHGAVIRRVRDLIAAGEFA